MVSDGVVKVEIRNKKQAVSGFLETARAGPIFRILRSSPFFSVAETQLYGKH